MDSKEHPAKYEGLLSSFAEQNLATGTDIPSIKLLSQGWGVRV